MSTGNYTSDIAHQMGRLDATVEALRKQRPTSPTADKE